MAINPADKRLRKTGISVVGDVAWGSHLCHFYDTKKDLLDALIPYFKAGLENRELCLWIISGPLTGREAHNALKQTIPDIDQYLADGSMQIRSYRPWYVNGRGFHSQRVITAWSKKLEEALARGYAGLRLSGDTAWVQTKHRKAFGQYEKQVDVNLAGKKIIALCTYPLAVSPAAQILDVARVHQVAVARRRGHWEIVETPELKQAKQQIASLNEELEERVNQRTADLGALNEALKKSERRYRELSRRLVEVHESERRYLARELHDQIGQSLTAVKINIEVIRSNGAHEVAGRLNESAAILDQLLQQVRQISLDLRPPLLDHLGLAAALRAHTDQQAERAGLHARFVSDALPDNIPAHIQMACFRIAQEAITNAVRHARAKNLDVELRSDGGCLRLFVQDDGAGFELATAEAQVQQQGLNVGLFGIRERAALAGGRAQIVSSSGKGTTIEVTLPFIARRENSKATGIPSSQQSLSPMGSYASRRRLRK